LEEQDQGRQLEVSILENDNVQEEEAKKEED
jgi:hypothetical protein